MAGAASLKCYMVNKPLNLYSALWPIQMARPCCQGRLPRRSRINRFCRHVVWLTRITLAGVAPAGEWDAMHSGMPRARNAWTSCCVMAFNGLTTTE